MESGLFGVTDAAVGVLVEVAELFSGERGRAAAEPHDFDMRASSVVGHSFTFRKLVDSEAVKSCLHGS